MRNLREQVQLLDMSHRVIYVTEITSFEAIFFARRMELICTRMGYYAIADMMYFMNVHMQFICIASIWSRRR